MQLTRFYKRADVMSVIAPVSPKVPIIKPAFNRFASVPYFVRVCGECVLLHVCVSVGYSVCTGRAVEASGSG